MGEISDQLRIRIPKRDQHQTIEECEANVELELQIGEVAWRKLIVIVG